MAAPKGHARYGGRGKGTPNKLTVEVKALAQEYTEEAVERLVDVMRNSTNERACVAAAQEILNRGHGKPHQSVDVAVTRSFVDVIRELGAD